MHASGFSPGQVRVYRTLQRLTSTFLEEMFPNFKTPPQAACLQDAVCGAPDVQVGCRAGEKELQATSQFGIGYKVTGKTSSLFFFLAADTNKRGFCLIYPKKPKQKKSSSSPHCSFTGIHTCHTEEAQCPITVTLHC